MSNEENEEVELEDTHEGETSENTYPQLGEAPKDEQLLSHLQLLLVWLRTLEERSLELLALPDSFAFFENADEEPEGEESNEIQSAISSLHWTLRNTVQQAVKTRQLLLLIREETGLEKAEIREYLSAIRSRLFGISQQLGVSFLDEPQSDEPQSDEIEKKEFARRVVGQWFIPHLRGHVLSFDRARCDLTVAMVEDDEHKSEDDEHKSVDDEHKSVDEESISTIESTDVLPNGFHPSTTPPPQGWHGPLIGNMTQLSGWVIPGSEISHRPIQNALRNQSEVLWGRVQGGRLCEIYFESEPRFTQCEERWKEELKENDS